MPKVLDKAAQLKKQSAKDRAALPKDTKQELSGIKKPEKVEVVKKEEKKMKTAEPSRTAIAMAAGKSNSTFSQFDADREESDSENEAPQHTNGHSNGTTATNGNAVEKKEKPTKETAADKKKKEKMTKKDEMRMLAEEEKAARKERVLGRLLNMLLIGYVLDFFKGQTETAKGPKQDGKKKKQNVDSGSSTDMLKKVDPSCLMILALAVVLFGARMGQEGYNPDFSMDGEPDYYDVMGVPRGASVMDIRKAYKGLALSWHPDKNPDCSSCAEKFGMISKAYETLSNVEDKKKYDNKEAREGALKAPGSVDLTAEDFESKVLRSNEVWLIQVYDPSEHACHSFNPIWTEVTSSHGGIARFGRLDVTKQRGALSYLPTRVAIFPTIFKMSRGHETETYIWSGNAEAGSTSLARFVTESYPDVPRFENGQDLSTWWAGDRPRVLVAGPALTKSGSRLGALQVRHTGYIWSDFFESASVDPRFLSEGLGAEHELTGKKDKWLVAARGRGSGAPVVTKTVEMLESVPTALQEIIGKTLGNLAPFISVRNHRQLCGAGGVGHSVRTYCLVIVDQTDDRVEQLLKELQSSRSAYADELKELADSGEGGTEEPFHIQAARISTASARWPSQPKKADHPMFAATWGEAEYAPAFLIELETRRIAAVKSPSLNELFQNIAYDDIKFKELEEEISFTRGLPDPEESLRDVLRHALTSTSGGLAAWLLLSVAAAVLPELSPPGAVAAMCSFTAVLLLLWPAACRCYLAILWPGSNVI